MTDYQALYNSVAVNPDKIIRVGAIVLKIKTNQSRYEAVAAETNVPWYAIACIHYREATLSFNHHMHNGDPLTARTVHVPAGRPVTGTPPFTWEESAVDAFRYMGMDKITDWGIPNMLFTLEKYNGLGYQHRGLNSPYLWSFTNQYKKGKFTSDHGFDSNVIDQQCGCVPLLKALIPNQKIK